MADREEGIDDTDVVDLDNEERYDEEDQRITTAYVEAAADALQRGDYEITG